MDDLSTRLRAANDPLTDEAADVIDELTTQVDRLSDVLSRALGDIRTCKFYSCEMR